MACRRRFSACSSSSRKARSTVRSAGRARKAWRRNRRRRGDRAQGVGLVVLAGQHDDLDVGGGGKHLLEQHESPRRPNRRRAAVQGPWSRPPDWWRRSCARALSRSLAVTDSNRSSDHLICFCSARSSSTISSGRSFSPVMPAPFLADRILFLRQAKEESSLPASLSFPGFQPAIRRPFRVCTVRFRKRRCPSPPVSCSGRA